MEKDYREIIFVVESLFKAVVSFNWKLHFLKKIFPLQTPNETLPLNLYSKIVGPGEKAHRIPGVNLFFPSSLCCAAREVRLMPIVLWHE